MSGARRAAARVTLTAAGLAAASIVASCGMFDSLRDEDAGEQTVTVGVLVPPGGWLAGDSDGVVAAVEVAIEQTTADLAGWTVEVVRVDEADDPQETTAAIEELIDGDAIAVVGGLTVPGVRAAQPVLDDASVPFISPADIDPTHTRGARPAAPLRPYGSYFRTSVSDQPTPDALVRYVTSSLDAQAFAVVDAGDPLAASAFTAAVDEAGGDVVFSHAPRAVDDLPTVVDGIAKQKAAAVAVTGSADLAAELAGLLRQAGSDAQLLVATSGTAEQFAEAAGSDGDGALTAIPAQLEPTTGLVSDQLAAQLEAAAKPAAGQFGGAAYDAGTAVGTALTRCLPPASSAVAARQGCLGEMSQVDFIGVTGHVAFDEFGDRRDATASIMTLEGGRWQSSMR